MQRPILATIQQSLIEKETTYWCYQWRRTQLENFARYTAIKESTSNLDYCTLDREMMHKSIFEFIIFKYIERGDSLIKWSDPPKSKKIAKKNAAAKIFSWHPSIFDRCEIDRAFLPSKRWSNKSEGKTSILIPGWGSFLVWAVFTESSSWIWLTFTAWLYGKQNWDVHQGIKYCMGVIILLDPVTHETTNEEWCEEYRFFQDNMSFS